MSRASSDVTVSRRRAGTPLARLFGRMGRSPGEAEYRKLEEKKKALAQATLEWHSLLREMEVNGESSDPRYESYFGAYLDAQQQEKQIDLQLFNFRNGLLGR
ncbi:MAG: hypothetical protein ACRDFX_08695 [Chloroflexota bacterium]